MELAVHEVNNDYIIWTIVKTGWFMMVALGLYLRFGFLSFLLGLRTIRLEKTPETLRLTAMDGAPNACWAAFSVGSLPLVLIWDLEAGLIVAAASLVVWLGFRVRICVNEEGARVVRTFAYIIPWSWRVYDEMPMAFVDGWGDFMDPEALYLGFEGGGSCLELGWGDRSTADRCEALAAEFNDAVRWVREPGVGEGWGRESGQCREAGHPCGKKGRS